MRMIHTLARQSSTIGLDVWRGLVGHSLAVALLCALAMPSWADYRRTLSGASDMHFVNIPTGERFAMGSCDGGAYLFKDYGNKRGRETINRLLCLGNTAPDSHATANEHPQHWVVLNQRIQISGHETTVGQFLAFIESAGRSDLPDEAFVAANSQADSGYRLEAPVTMVSWDDAQAFIDWLNDTRARKDSGVYRLPSEAEWEYAARADSLARFGYGHDMRDLANHAWYSANAQRPGLVGRKRPNDWGLHDMHGNVWEWTQDWYAAYGDLGEQLSDDPTGPHFGEMRVVRGGSWRTGPEHLRSAARSSADPGMRRDHVGFRVVRELR